MGPARSGGVGQGFFEEGADEYSRHLCLPRPIRRRHVPDRLDAAHLKHQLRTAAARLGGRSGRALYQRIRSLPPLPAQVVHVVKSSGVSARVPWPQYPPTNYLGQLSEEFQGRLALERADLERSDCDFYHTATFSDGSVAEGAWDLRGREEAYLGSIALNARRVLELGPASGHLTYYMESQGADVVCLDTGFDVSNDLLPYDGIDVSGPTMQYMVNIGQVQNAWWYLHRDRRSAAKVVYGSIYDPPRDIGTFDVATFGSILLHLRNPFNALEQAARRTTEAIVVTEVIDPAIAEGSDAIRFHPTRSKEISQVWWSFSPLSIEVMLDTLGFHAIETTFHSQLHHWGHDMSQPAQEVPMYTVIGRRR
jgi:SAM-dependent methyltransferase